ncbi:MAG TPA: CD225/dispanin family protein [Thermoanaerobaculia bacterium]|jgi:hypothetical protein|nr:CD225/dispanin family protein [Thermoanaerobaculia bacterium]
MYCTQCGSPRPDGATVCPACGKPVPQFGMYAPATPVGSIPNYLVQSILVTLCCCLPGGIVAIIFASQVNSKLLAGDMAGAEAASKNAKLWCWISFGVGIAAGIIGGLNGLSDAFKH